MSTVGGFMVNITDLLYLPHVLALTFCILCHILSWALRRLPTANTPQRRSGNGSWVYRESED